MGSNDSNLQGREWVGGNYMDQDTLMGRNAKEAMGCIMADFKDPKLKIPIWPKKIAKKDPAKYYI